VSTKGARGGVAMARGAGIRWHIGFSGGKVNSGQGDGEGDVMGEGANAG
jgi:hypothetical protein